MDVRAFTILHIGKETNLLEQQEEGVLLIDPQAVYLGEQGLAEICSQLDRVSIPKLADLARVSPEMLRKAQRGDRRPSAKTLEAITEGLGLMLDEGEG